MYLLLLFNMLMLITCVFLVCKSILSVRTIDYCLIVGIIDFCWVQVLENTVIG